MRKWNEEKDGEMWDAVVAWFNSMEIAFPATPPTWVHKEDCGNPTFYHSSGLMAYVLGFKRGTDNRWVFTTVRVKRCEDD